MDYRILGKTGERVSVLGFGCMRLPVLKEDMGKVNEAEAIRMIRYAIDQGVNYIDTAYPYHEGNSELIVGKALQDGYREKVHIATKLPIWNVKKHEDMARLLDEQLSKLQTKQIEFYLVHALNKKYWSRLLDLKLFDFLLKAQEEGKIKHIGFSFHDEYEVFEEIVNRFPWSFCLIQYNYLDEDFQAGRKGLEYAAGKGLGIVIMEPLRGGILANKLTLEAQQIIHTLRDPISPAELALKWIWDHPEVGVILSGMTEMEHVEENVRAASNSKSFSQEQKKAVLNIQQSYRDRIQVYCTSCKYCLPCPSGVDIPQCFEHYNRAHMLDNVSNTRFWYNQISKASKCTECGLCENHCPQNIPIREKLKLVRDCFETSNDIQFP